MAPQDIFRKLKAQPFQPIRIFISDGAYYDVTEPTHTTSLLRKSWSV
jgi:hypothetical protein